MPVTDFPNKGGDKKITLRNSKFPQFDYRFALDIKTNFPDIWDEGGTEVANESFEMWGKVRNKTADELTASEKEWIVRRERFMERHEKDKNLPGVVAVMKWGGIITRGESYMKQTINEAKKKKEASVYKSEFNFQMTLKSVGNRKIEGYAATSDQDRDGEVIPTEVLQAAAQEYLEYGTLLYEHGTDPTYGMKPIGSVTEGTVDEKGFRVTAQISDDWIWNKIELEELKAFSVGGKMEMEMQMIDGTQVPVATNIDIFEVSVVAVPANREAQFSIAKALQKCKQTALENYNQSKANKNFMLELLKNIRDKANEGLGVPDEDTSEEPSDEETTKDASEEDTTKSEEPQEDTTTKSEDTSEDEEKQQLKKENEELKQKNQDLETELSRKKEQEKEVEKYVKEIDEKLEKNLNAKKKAKTDEEVEGEASPEDVEKSVQDFEKVKNEILYG